MPTKFCWKIKTVFSVDAASMTSVCPFVRPSVTFVDCDHVVQQKLEMGRWSDKRCLAYLHSEADPDLSILLIWFHYLLRKISGKWNIKFNQSVNQFYWRKGRWTTNIVIKINTNKTEISMHTIIKTTMYSAKI